MTFVFFLEAVLNMNFAHFSMFLGIDEMASKNKCRCERRKISFGSGNIKRAWPTLQPSS
jgi:hypothetical protein